MASIKKRLKHDKLDGQDRVAQCGAICVRLSQNAERNVEVLLITSRDSGRWVIPKGWSKLKKSSHETAMLEAWQEAGVRGRVWKKILGYYTYSKALSNGRIVPARVRVHMLNVATLEADFPEVGQRRLQWFSPDEASQLVHEAELQEILSKVTTETAGILRRFDRRKIDLPSLPAENHFSDLRLNLSCLQALLSS